MKKLLCISLLFPFFANAADTDYSLTVKDQRFQPNELIVMPGKKVKLIIYNQDAMPIEFESTDLSREVVVPGHGEVAIYVGPLDSGSYQFFNDFNHDMKGSIVVNATNKGN